MTHLLREEYRHLHRYIVIAREQKSRIPRPTSAASVEFCNWTKTDEVAMQRNTYLKSVFCYSLTIGTTNQVPRRMNCHILTLNAAATIKNISFQFSVVSDNSDRTFSNRGRHPLENFQNKIWSHNSRAPALFDLVNLATVLAGDARGRFSKQQKSC